MKRHLVLLVVMLLLSFPGSLIAQVSAPAPTDGWQTSTPEEQGMNSAKLADWWNNLLIGEPDAMGTAFIPYTPGTSTFIHSALVIRHGKVVLDASVYPFTSAQPHEMYSTTKTVLSTLIGIAIDQGYIENEDVSIWDFFSRDGIANMDDQKAAITLRHLLTHTSGLGIDETKVYSPDIGDRTKVQFLLDSPMVTRPGTTYAYSDGGAHLVSAILQQATGMSTLEFAQANLFKPLGITDVRWDTDAQGLNYGGSNFALSANDLAKIGYLFLHNGAWNGQQIVSQAWVETSIKDQLEPLQPHFWEGYSNFWYDGPIGYWFNEPEGKNAAYRGYAAFGWGMQILMVIPELDLVVVTTGDLQVGMLFDGLTNFIVPAVESNEALPANPDAFASLQAAVEATTHPVPSPVPAMPAAAQTISGKTYTLADNALGWKSFSLTFNDQDAMLTLDVGSTPIELPVGLEGIYRVSTVGMPQNATYFWHDAASMAVKGAWQSDQTFMLEMWDTIGMTGFVVTIPFDTLTISVNDIVTPELSLVIQAAAQPG